jgi:hypothetical protein
MPSTDSLNRTVLGSGPELWLPSAATRVSMIALPANSLREQRKTVDGQKR